MDGSKILPYEYFNEFGIFTLQEQENQGDNIAAFKYLKGRLCSGRNAGILCGSTRRMKTEGEQLLWRERGMLGTPSEEGVRSRRFRERHTENTLPDRMLGQRLRKEGGRELPSENYAENLCQTERKIPKHSVREGSQK